MTFVSIPVPLNVLLIASTTSTLIWSSGNRGK